MEIREHVAKASCVQWECRDEFSLFASQQVFKILEMI
jgi:hypothetical protein